MKNIVLMMTALGAGLVSAQAAYDVVIYGSSPAALTAAIEAQRHGKTAVVVSPETRIGGLTTGGLGQTDIGNKSAFGGLALQFYRDVADYYKDPANWKYEKRGDYVPDGQCAGTLGADAMWTFEPSAALKILEGWEKKYKLDIRRGEFLDRGPTGVRREGARIAAIRTLSGKTFAGRMFVDATYEGDLLAAAGVSYTVGREANSVYGETISGVERRLARHHQFNPGVSAYVKPGEASSGLLPYVEPDTNEPDGAGDRRVQAYCFRMCLTDDPANRIPFVKPANYNALDYELLLRNLEAIRPETFAENAKKPWTFMPWINSRMPNRKTDTNNRTGFSTDFVGANHAWPEASYAEREKILKAHLDYQMGLVWTLANNPRVPSPIRDEVAKWGTCKDEFQDGLGNGWQSQLYVREGRRLVGDYVETEADVLQKRHAPHPVAMAAYGMDSHNCRRYVDKEGFVRNEGNVEDWRAGGKPYAIEYGALVPKKSECANLYVPVCLSASHMAFGSIRMEPVFFALGQVAGAAASLAIDAGCAAQDLDYAKLRDVLVAEGQVISVPAASQTVFLEAEAFEDWGGWVNDTQFMDQMGSPYLLAHGLGRPVADAKTTFVARNPGTYKVYVRTKNWYCKVRDMAEFREVASVQPGAFRVIVNGVEMETAGTEVFQDRPAPDWHWRHVGDATVRAGVNTVALHDLDGFDGRCDAVVLTTAADVRPVLEGPRSPSVVTKPLPPKAYDLVVVGGGIAGICSAVSAARLGLKVALVHDRPVLGGNNSSEVRVHLGAWQNMPPYPRLGDVVAEIGPAKEGNARSAATYEDARKLAVVKAEKNIDLYLNLHVDGVLKAADGSRPAGRLAAVEAKDTRTRVRHTFEARWFVDCTGDGTVGYLADADFAQGREAKSTYNEPWAPEKADTMTMGASVQWYAGKKGEGKEEKERSADFPLLSWMIPFNEESASTGLRGDWWWEAGIGRDQIAEAERIRDYGLLVAYSNWAFLKNESARKADYADKELKWVAYNAGRRESRRLLGDFIITENDLMNRNIQDDGTCVATWTIDLHLPKSKEKTHFEGEPFQSDSLNHKIWPYPIPYRCLYSRKIANLFMAGRDISVSHIALGTTRLMRTNGMMGEVVGMAASLCKKYDCDPRQVYTDHLGELKNLMTKGVGDGKAHPSQMYNIQDSLDPVFRDKKNGNHQVRK